MSMRYVGKAFRAPEYSPAPSHRIVCTQYAKCQNCPYPGHGFRCWSEDGKCLRTVMRRINRRKEK